MAEGYANIAHHLDSQVSFMNDVIIKSVKCNVDLIL